MFRRSADDILGTIAISVMLLPCVVFGVGTITGGPLDLSRDSGPAWRVVQGTMMLLVSGGMIVGLVVALILDKKVFSSPSEPSSSEPVDDRLITWD